MPTRLITPSQLSLFSISPVIGAWWEELLAQKLFDGSKPEVSELDQQLFADGLRHEQVLLTKLEKEGRSIARLPVAICSIIRSSGDEISSRLVSSSNPIDRMDLSAGHNSILSC